MGGIGRNETHDPGFGIPRFMAHRIKERHERVVFYRGRLGQRFGKLSIQTAGLTLGLDTQLGLDFDITLGLGINAGHRAVKLAFRLALDFRGDEIGEVMDLLFGKSPGGINDNHTIIITQVVDLSRGEFEIAPK